MLLRRYQYGTAMPILTIRHVTTYHYHRPVAFGEHRMMLRPRDDNDQKLIDCGLDIAPVPSQLSWSRDIFGNHVATANFAARASILRMDSKIRLDHAPGNFCADDIDDVARTYPFAYPVHERSCLERYIEAYPTHPDVARWAAGFLREDGSTGTGDLIVGMTQAIKRTFKHVARHEQGVQEPHQTLTIKSGSCRDVAMLMIAALRSLGIAARFVSGYLHLPDDDDSGLTGGNTHAWVQAYLPGPGWVDADPSRGQVGNENLVRVAVARDPRDAIPLQGIWMGAASDHLAMKVAVKVRATAA